MRRVAFFLAIAFLFLLSMLFNLPAKKVSLPEELSSFQENQKLLIAGNVAEEKYFGNYKILFLDNEFQLKCPLPCGSFLGENISAIVLLENYNNKPYLKILKISP